LSGRLDEATHLGASRKASSAAFHAGHALEIALAAHPDATLALLEQPTGHVALQFAEDDLVHVAPCDANEALQQLCGAGGAAERREQLGIDGMFEQFAVDQDTVAIEDEQSGHCRPRL